MYYLKYMFFIAFAIFLLFTTLKCDNEKNSTKIDEETLFQNENYPSCEVFSIGIYKGASPLDMYPAPEAENPVLTAEDVTDLEASIVADPFMIIKNNKWYMFFEVLDKSLLKGRIGLAQSLDGYNWTYERIVIEEPFHLSYPYVFEWENQIFIVPESNHVNTVRLYRATTFPYKWEYVKDLLSGNFVDPSLIYYDNKWWLFAESNPQGNDILRMFYADYLFGQWTEHPQSPLINGNPDIARPGGRMIQYDKYIIRYNQDDFPTYGNMVRIFLINELSTSSYNESEFKVILTASGSGWNARGMHHIDPHKIRDNLWIACVDGWR